MDLILKPTEACNFSCTFCSSSKLVEDKSDRLDLEQVFTFLHKFPYTNTIILNGGDPTLVPVDYYWKLIKFLEDNDYSANLSFTTNLWRFWLEWKNEKVEKKWTKLFLHKRVNVTTSFQYGTERQISPGVVFDEEIFLKISNLFLDKVGYRPSFISVITKNTLSTAINNVRLAKSIGVDCKLNYANMSGECEEPLMLSSIYKVYLDIVEEGLFEHEWNTRQMLNRLEKTKQTMCPLNRDCDEGIRVLHPDGKYFSCGSFADDLEYEIDFKKEMASDVISTPLQDDMGLNSLKDECYSCKMFQICNGCKKHIKDLKKSDIVEEHCTQMKLIADSIEAFSSKLPEVEVRNDNYYESAGFFTDERV